MEHYVATPMMLNCNLHVCCTRSTRYNSMYACLLYCEIVLHADAGTKLRCCETVLGCSLLG
jgi:hypothetical protein